MFEYVSILNIVNKKSEDIVTNWKINAQGAEW